MNAVLTPKPNLEYIKRKWETKMQPEDKGGHFNLKLYLDYLTVKNQKS